MILSLGFTVPQYVAALAATNINSYFTPVNYLIFLVLVLVAMTMYYMYKWGKVCRENVQVLVVKADGHGDYELAPMTGGYVSLKNPHNDSVKMWPINKLATIDVPYPGDGFVPDFMKKSIRQVIVDEEDWEPLLNRSPYKNHVASPDVKEFIEEIALEIEEENPDLSRRLLALSGTLNPAPTREMIASPTVLGNLMHEKITEAVITVNKEMLDSVTTLMKRLNKIISPTTFYIGIGILAILTIINLALTVSARSDMTSMMNDIEAVRQAIGVTSEVR